MFSELGYNLYGCICISSIDELFLCEQKCVTLFKVSDCGSESIQVEEIGTGELTQDLLVDGVCNHSDHILYKRKFHVHTHTQGERRGGRGSFCQFLLKPF